MPVSFDGRHENGQNFLVDRATIRHVVALVAATQGPILELGPGSGALTRPLLELGRPLTCIEIDDRHVRSLSLSLPEARVHHGDYLRHPLPDEAHVVAANVPFHLTTATLRRLMRANTWTHAVLIVQWEVARRRASVGGSTLMTAQWAPWYEFRVEGKVPASAFRPKPNVDAGILHISRRPRPLLTAADRERFHDLARRVFTGRGRGIAAILERGGLLTRAEAAAYLRRVGVSQQALPKDLDVEAWVELFHRAASGSWPDGAASVGSRNRSRRRQQP